ncbi:MAG: hypothetical protein ACR2JV_04570 [Gaiellales bacterium]
MRIVGIIIGALIVLVSLPFVFMGIGMVAWLGDGSGLDIPLKGLNAPPKVVAIVSPEFSVKAQDIPSQLRDASATLHVTPQAGTAPLFIGLAPSQDVKRYLKGATIAHPEVKQTSGTGSASGSSDGGGAPDPQAIAMGDGAELQLTVDPGRRRKVAPPKTRAFWIRTADSASGDITVSLADLEGRNVRVVVMRADGKPGIAVDATLHFHAPILRTAGFIVLLIGLVILAIGAGLIVLLARRGRRTPAAAAAPPDAGDAPAVDTAPPAADDDATST